MLWTIESQVKYSLQYCFTQKVASVHSMTSKVKLTLWYPACLLPCFPKIALSKKDLKQSSTIIRGMSGADLQNCGFVDITVTSNDITAKSRFTKQACAFILGFGFCKEFKLVTIAPCAYNNTYLWSHAMSLLYTSLKNQRPTTKIAGFTLDISSKLEVYFKCT